MNNVRVRLPRKLAKSYTGGTIGPDGRLSGGTLNEAGRLNPVGDLGITLNLQPIHRVTMTLAENDLPLAMHDLVEVYNQNGSVGVYRVTKITKTYKKNRKIELSHGLDVFSDATLATIEEFSGTVDQFLQMIMDGQTQKINGQFYWRLGRCDDHNTWNKDLKYDNAMSCLTDIAKTEEDYMFTFDMSTFPWTLNFVARDSEVLSEFRLNRNTESCVVTEDDSELCTRLYLSVTSETDDDEGNGTYIDEGYFTYNDTAAQADFGVVCKTAGVDQEDFETTAALEAWVDAYFGRHNKPGIQITIDGVELNRLTGEPIDEVHLSRICRVALPEYSSTFNERVISVNYPDALRRPTYVRISLANKRQTSEDAFSEIKETATSASKSAGGAGRAAHNDATYFRRVIGDTANGLYSRIEQTAEYIRAEVVDTANGLYSKIEQTASYIRAEVANTANGLYSKIEQTASYIRSEVSDTANGLYSKIEQTASYIRSEVSDTANGLNSKIDQTASYIRSEVSSATSSLRSEISQTASTIRAEVADATSAASIVLAINNGASSASISADKINLSGYVTASQLETVDAKIGNLTTGVTKATLLKTSTLQADSFSFGGDSARWGTLSLGSIKSMTVMTHSIENKDFDHYHGVTISESSGVITVTIGAAASSEGSDSFNMADTAFYQDAVSAAIASVKVKAADITEYQNAVYNSTTHNTTVYIQAEATNGNYGRQTFHVSGADAYAAGVAAGEGEFTAVVVTPIKSTSAIRIDSTPVTLYNAGTTTKYDRGTGLTARPVVSSGGTIFYEANAQATYRNAGSGTKYDRGNSVTAREVVSSGGTYYYTTSNGIKVKNYGSYTLYVRKQNASGYYYESAGNHNWYYADSGGTQYYNRANSTQLGSATTFYRGDGGSFTPQGSEVVVTPIKTTSAIRLGAAGTYYPGDGGAFTPQGTTQDAYKKLSSGGTIFYEANPAATYYTRSS